MLLVGNGRLITRDEAFPYAEDGAVALDGEVIKEVGALSELRAKYPDAEFVDARGGVIMPGLINVHTHIYSGLARGLSIDGFNPTNFLEVLDGQCGTSTGIWPWTAPGPAPTPRCWTASGTA